MLRYALVCNAVVVGSSAFVSAGSIVSHSVVIGGGHTVPPYVRVSLCSQVQQEVRSWTCMPEYDCINAHAASVLSTAHYVHALPQGERVRVKKGVRIGLSKVVVSEEHGRGGPIEANDRSFCMGTCALFRQMLLDLVG